MTLLVADRLGKAYCSYRSEWQRILRWFHFPTKPSSEHWVIRDVSFSIEQGEAIAIVGKNGAGKSTLLKMITGTLQPSEGAVHIQGRIAAILELGMGFSPELSGRQNVIHVAGLMGIDSEQISQLLPEIESFADISEYFEQAVRTYSSGMQVRLAFALATAIRPDILIVDEALAVGDAAFQRKCFRRIQEYQALGTTLLLVTHDTETVKKTCNKAIYIQDGKVAAYGSAKSVCDTYERALLGAPAKESKTSTHPSQVEKPKLVDPTLKSDCEVSYGDGRAEIEDIWLETDEGTIANLFKPGQKLILKYRVRFNYELEDISFAFMIKTREGVSLVGMNTDHLLNVEPKRFSAGDSTVVSFTLDNAFAPGAYYVNCGVRRNNSNGTEFLHRRVDALIFRVQRGDEVEDKIGLINTPVSFSME
ncbi:ABC-type polysaccharide/polyol phosphate transport system, ATPase component [Pseudomonas knackmussii B13]|uniref:ABC-type polysaccharide/polyol phosphate transport system, ATPase component n=1 Tax=Pseudomonas knackmussii (strain DSM 6978 / CCUG 54928 / LMG 23759 / B13) TaxID=1301098 RepID=A0A024HP10_PSEKB|nr:ABC transporter ATP-binding protein [Pseudomonas knackmussii]CDF86800.1 ABC-type polysaccharide/polyol phosphate transport system, ATPase component [Pseudomonas knackmussii B13]